jgi:MoaA/NifB/PqqE/SkfB family radical SAM enzyme
MGAAIGLATAWVKIRILGRRIPLFAAWNITFRCNLRCKYCGAFEAPDTEWSTAEVIEGLDALWELGTRWLTFSGGEPLVRADLGEILKYAKQKGFRVYVSTNGSLIPAKQELLQWIDHVNLSLDGRKEVHDAVRGEDSFDRMLAGLAVCERAKVPVTFLCALSRFNLDAVEDVLAISREHGTRVMFQPATTWMNSSLKSNPLAPEPEAFRKTIDTLIAMKKQGAPISNSATGLRYLRHWPDRAPIWCSAGALTCTIEADGTLLACHHTQVGAFLKQKAGRGSLDAVFKDLAIPRGCAQCWCAPLVELAMVFSLRPEALWNAARTFGR